MALQPGDSLLNGQYRILRSLGRGGFGFVYHAQDTHIGEQVAIKELIPGLVGDEETLKRFLAEARATMRLTHKRIVRTHHVFPEGSNYYIVMEYMPGGSLEERLRQGGSLAVEEAVRIAADVCEGLACAHEEGVVHCDLKPANILFDAKGSAKVADFGIAHVSGEMLSRSWHTPAGFVAGTVPYMSPEQADGVRDDPRIDVYSLGAVLYRMLTGKTYLAFDNQETPRAQMENLQRIYGETPLPPSTHNRKVPAWLDGVVLRALVKRLGERHGSVEAMRAALQQGQPAPAMIAFPLPLPPTKLAPAERAAGATPIPARPAPSRPAAGAAPAAKKPSSLPVWFWPAAVAAGVLLVFLVLAIASLGRGGDGGAAAGAGPAETAVAARAATRSATGTPAATLQPTPTNTPIPPTSTPKPTVPAAGATQTRSKDGMVMVYVPAGEFLMGSTDADSYAGDWEKPQHTVYLDAFWIDRTEVTNAQYRQCVQEGSCTAPSESESCTRDGYYGNSAYDGYPVIYVDWSQANAYCRWAGARLPTEAEWEKAARGMAGRIYPWGNQDPDCNRANLREHSDSEGDTGSVYDHCPTGCVGDTAQVGSYPTGASPYGALDMAGNVGEWVNDWWDEDYYSYSSYSNPQGPDAGTYKVMRGGDWLSAWREVRAAYRRDMNPPFRNFLGFRCAASRPGE